MLRCHHGNSYTVFLLRCHHGNSYTVFVLRCHHGNSYTVFVLRCHHGNNYTDRYVYVVQWPVRVSRKWLRATSDVWTCTPPSATVTPASLLVTMEMPYWMVTIATRGLSRLLVRTRLVFITALIKRFDDLFGLTLFLRNENVIWHQSLTGMFNVNVP